MSDKLKGLYDKLPVLVQNAVLTGYSMLLDRERYGGKYDHYQQLLSESQWWTAGELQAYQEEQLGKLIRHAYDSVPYYRTIFDKRKLKPDDIKKQEDLQKLPLLTRKDIQENFSDLISTSYKSKQLKFGHTSGTTGAPLEVAYDLESIYITYALMDRQYKWCGAKLGRSGDNIAVLRGNVIVPVERKKPPYWRHNYYHNQLLMSAFHMTLENLPIYLQKLREFKPAVVDGYPSTLYVVAKYLLNNKLTLPVKAVISSSETLYDFQRETIEAAFACKIFDYYAAAERVIFSTECDSHEGHHISSEYGITEVLDKDWLPVPCGESGTMVGTSLHNYGMPLIRYVTSDISAFKDKTCSCGRNLPLMEDVATKAEDILALKDGRLISPSALTHPFKPMHGIEASQIIQEDYGYIRIKLIPNAEFKDSDKNHLIREFKARLGEDIRIEVELVDEIPRTKSGKFKWVISKVDKGIKMPD